MLCYNYRYLTKKIIFWFRSYCYCGDKLGRYGIKSDSECNGNCSGNIYETCGGVWRNSVYKTNVNDS